MVLHNLVNYLDEPFVFYVSYLFYLRRRRQILEIII
jgi:hypothetical protein